MFFMSFWIAAVFRLCSGLASGESARVPSEDYSPAESPALDFSRAQAKDEDAAVKKNDNKT